LGGISLCPFGIYVEHQANPSTINHEKIHWYQQVEMLIVPFYIWYLVEFLIRRVSHKKNDAYLGILFEREAFANQDNLTYLQTRKPYAWLKSWEE